MKRRGPRAAATYRGARHHSEDKPLPFVVRPYQIKPPVVKINALGFAYSRIRPQPKTYRPNERLLRRLAA